MRKRSKYRPKGVRLDPIRYVLEGMKPMSSHPAALTLRIKNHQALHDLVQGNGTRDSMDMIIQAMNIAEALAIVNPDKLGAIVRHEITAAQDAVLTMARRGLERDRFLFTGPELNAVNAAMEIHDAQLDACTIAELEKATDLVIGMIKNNKARAI